MKTFLQCIFFKPPLVLSPDLHYSVSFNNLDTTWKKYKP